jgi:hypothetical protein
VGVLDLIFLPIYIWLFSKIFAWRRKRYTDPLLQKYHLLGFKIKVIFSILFSFYLVFISTGDSYTLYFTEGRNMAKFMYQQPENISWLFEKTMSWDKALLTTELNEGYFYTPPNYAVARLSAFFCLFNFGGIAAYTVINLMFALLGFVGIWRLFLFFYNEFPLYHKEAFFSLFYLFSFTFWSSGASKEAMCIAALGISTWSLYKILYLKKQIVLNAFLVFVAVAVALRVKSYIIASYLPFFILFIVLKSFTQLKNRFAKYGLFLVIVAISLFSFQAILANLTELVSEYLPSDITEGVSKYQYQYELAGSVGSTFTLGVQFKGSMSSLFLCAPFAVIVTFFRPFLWEVNSLSTLQSALESLFFIYLFIVAIKFNGIRGFFKNLRGNPFIIFAFSFAILFGLFVGLTTTNFGSLVRYKIPCMPFFVFGMFVLIKNAKPNWRGFWEKFF